MNGQLALMATLAAVGGRWLRDGANEPAPELLTGNSSFQYVGSFKADLPSRRFLGRRQAVSSPEQWLAGLHSLGVKDLSLLTDLSIGGPLPSHLASAFSNSGTWALLATGNPAPTLWTLRWDVVDRDAPDSRIWSVAGRSVVGEGFRVPQVGVIEARTRLSETLGTIREFAEGYDELRSWSTWFAKADALLEDPAPTAPYHADLLPPDAALDRRQLAASVIQGWVFGGMGSWNDSGPANPAAQREYEQVGADLYSALLAALPAATNGA